MKKLLFLFLLVLSVLICPLSVDAQDDSMTIRVGVYDNYPKIYKDKNGEIKGFWADITNYIAKEENLKIEYVFGTWSEGLNRLANGEIDLMVDVAYSDDRAQIYDFNNETGLISWGVFYTKKGLELSSFMDLEGKKIAVMKSGILYSGRFGLKGIITSFNIHADLIDVDIYDDVFKLLDRGEADVGVVNWFYGVASESKYRVNRSSIFFQPDELKFALTKNASRNKYLIDILDSNLSKLKDDRNSAYYISIQNHFGQYLKTIEVLPKWLNTLMVVAGMLVVFAGILLLSMIINQKALKQQFAKKIFELERQGENYRWLIESSTNQVFMIDRNYNFIYVNKVAADELGKTVDQIVGSPVSDFFPGKMTEQFKRNCDDVFRTGKPKKDIEEKIILKNKEFVSSTTLNSVKDEEGKIVAVMGVIRDISGYKEIEEGILSNNAILTEQFKSAPDGILIVGVNGEVVLSNEKFVEMWGMPQELLLMKDDKKMLEFVIAKLKDPKKFTEKVDYLYKNKNEKSFDEVALIDGRVFQRYSAPLIDLDRNYLGRIWYFCDIAERSGLVKKES